MGSLNHKIDTIFLCNVLIFRFEFETNCHCTFHFTLIKYSISNILIIPNDLWCCATLPIITVFLFPPRESCKDKFTIPSQIIWKRLTSIQIKWLFSQWKLSNHNNNSMKGYPCFIRDDWSYIQTARCIEKALHLRTTKG